MPDISQPTTEYDTEDRFEPNNIGHLVEEYGNVIRRAYALGQRIKGFDFEPPKVLISPDGAGNANPSPARGTMKIRVGLQVG